MKKSFSLISILIIGLAVFNFGMARHGQYDEEARAAEREAKQMRKAQKESKNPVSGVASGVKQATVDSTAGFVSETADGTSDAPIIGTIEGARKGSGALADNAIKGAVKVATLGYGDVDQVKVEEPESNTDETTKFSISLPGT